jgi:hypothetical protein
MSIEIEELKAQIAALTAKVATLESMQGRIVVNHPIVPSSFAMPSEDELDRPRKISATRRRERPSIPWLKARARRRLVVAV